MSERQSPVDVPADAPVHEDDLAFDYRPTPLRIGDNPYALQVDCEPGSSVVIEGARWQLVQFHLHFPSEHHRAGMGEVGELHLVHAADDGSLAVVGLWLHEGARQWALDPLVAAPEGDLRRTIDPSRLLPSRQAYWAYDGSLTTPPYTEGVRWRLLLEPISVSATQLRALSAARPANNRPLQPLHERRFQ
jgi:carbonic anhydrase